MRRQSLAYFGSEGPASGNRSPGCAEEYPSLRVELSQSQLRRYSYYRSCSAVQEFLQGDCSQESELLSWTLRLPACSLRTAS